MQGRKVATDTQLIDLTDIYLNIKTLDYNFKVWDS